MRTRDHRAEAARRPAWRWLYKTARWIAIRAHQLATEPLCRMCKARGVVTPATTVDHVEQHHGNAEKFFAGPFQSLCDICHAGPKQSQERTGALRGCAPDGTPLDPQHPWNREDGG